MLTLTAGSGVLLLPAAVSMFKADCEGLILCGVKVKSDTEREALDEASGRMLLDSCPFQAPFGSELPSSSPALRLASLVDLSFRASAAVVVVVVVVAPACKAETDRGWVSSRCVKGTLFARLAFKAASVDLGRSGRSRGVPA